MRGPITASCLSTGLRARTPLHTQLQAGHSEVAACRRGFTGCDAWGCRLDARLGEPRVLLTRRLHALQPLAHWSCRLGLEELLVLLPRKFGGVHGPCSGDIRVELRAHHSNLVYVWLQA